MHSSELPCYAVLNDAVLNEQKRKRRKVVDPDTSDEEPIYDNPAMPVAHEQIARRKLSAEAPRVAPAATVGWPGEAMGWHGPGNATPEQGRACIRWKQRQNHLDLEAAKAKGREQEEQAKRGLEMAKALDLAFNSPMGLDRDEHAQLWEQTPDDVWCAERGDDFSFSPAAYESAAGASTIFDSNILQFLQSIPGQELATRQRPGHLESTLERAVLSNLHYQEACFRLARMNRALVEERTTFAHLRTRIQTLTKELDKAQVKGRCTVCMDAPCTRLVRPCNHFCLCEQCAHLMLLHQERDGKCPICRHEFDEIEECYLC